MSEPIVLAIDPGNAQSAYMLLGNGKPVEFGKVDNADLLACLDDGGMSFDWLAIETLKPRGMPTSFEEMQTQFWAGRFVQACGKPFSQVFRMNVKIHHCGRAHAKDSNIRAALIDRFGGKEKAIGRKKTPGPLYGVSQDVWSALAIALYFDDVRQSPQPPVQRCQTSR